MRLAGQTTLAAVWLSAAALTVTQAESILLPTLLKEDAEGIAQAWISLETQDIKDGGSAVQR